METPFKNKVAIVTGGSFGIGRATAIAFAKKGAKVAIVIIGLNKTAALKYAKSGIRVNAVCPGAIKTPMIDRITGNKNEVEEQFEGLEPIGRLGQPEEVANAVIWMCSDEASFVTGHALTLDGGWVAQ